MQNKIPIINLDNVGELAKPVNTLIEKISDAIAGVYAPTQIRRIAEAEADAAKIRAQAKIEISELERRAIARFFIEEGNKQNNIETITRKALPDVTEEARPKEVEDDWIVHFFDKCRLTSDDDMQNLWAKVLSGQVNSPGSYSKIAIDIMSRLEKSDAILFTKLCDFSFHIGVITPLIYAPEDPIYSEHGINFDGISHLENLGLLQSSELAYLRTGLNQKGITRYFNKPVYVEFKVGEKYQMNIGRIRLTHPGLQLSRICDSKPVEGFIEYVQSTWKSLGYIIEQDVKQPDQERIKDPEAKV